MIYKGELITSLVDVVGVIRRELGDELADFTTEHIQRMMVELGQFEIRAQSAELSLDLTVEEWETVVRDARDALDKELFDVEDEMFDSFKVPKKRLNRKTLEKILENLDDAL